MNTCHDHNHTPVKPGDWATYIDPSTGGEEEGEITACHAGNKVTMDAESGCITVNASDIYVHPNAID